MFKMAVSPCSWHSKRLFLASLLPSTLWSGHCGTISSHSIIASPSPATHLSSPHISSPPASAMSALPPRSVPASAVRAPGGTSCRIFAQGKTSLVAAQDSLPLIKLPGLLMLTQASSHPPPLTHQKRWLALLA